MMQFRLLSSPLLKRTIVFTDETVLLALWLSSMEIFMYPISTDIRVNKDLQPVNFTNQKLLKNRLKNRLA